MQAKNYYKKMNFPNKLTKTSSLSKLKTDANRNITLTKKYITAKS